MAFGSCEFCINLIIKNLIVPAIIKIAMHRAAALKTAKGDQ